MMDMDVSYNEYANLINDDGYVNIYLNGQMYQFKINNNKISKKSRFLENKNYNLWLNCEKINEFIELAKIKEEERLELVRKNKALSSYFMQRPDVKIIYDDLQKEITMEQDTLEEIVNKMGSMQKYLFSDELKEKYDLLMVEEKKIREKLESLKERENGILNVVFEYYGIYEKIQLLICEIQKYEQNNEIYDEGYYDEQIKKACFDSERLDYCKLKMELKKYKLMMEEKDRCKEEILNYIVGATTLDDVKEKLKGYDSTIGIVPAGEWDCHINPKYECYGYITGLTGSFEGPQGKETGYDSRKGAEKENYRQPDSSLLELLASVTDENGNILYPLSSFEEGGEYYYHIFGVNPDGTINLELIDNPRFGLKMLGDYLLIGSDQRENRKRGSKVMTSLGPAIVFDYGTIVDLIEDSSHIDISMDEVLFWLKDFSHNKERNVESLIGIYDWCTPSSFDGTIDLDYEHMERYYVNNINIKYNTNFTCFLDRVDFKSSTNYSSQDEFVYQLK